MRRQPAGSPAAARRQPAGKDNLAPAESLRNKNPLLVALGNLFLFDTDGIGLGAILFQPMAGPTAMYTTRHVAKVFGRRI